MGYYVLFNEYIMYLAFPHIYDVVLYYSALSHHKCLFWYILLDRKQPRDEDGLDVPSCSIESSFPSDLLLRQYIYTHSRDIYVLSARQEERRQGGVVWHYQNYYCYTTTSLGITMRKRINRVVVLRRAKCVYSPEKFPSTNDEPLFII